MRLPPNSARIRFAGVALLLAYFCALPGLLPVLFTVLARCEGSHGVVVQAAVEETRVVLTHRVASSALPHDAIHRHCLAAQLLASISQRDSNGGPDHVVKFLRDRNEGYVRAVAPEATLTADNAAPQLAVIAKLVAPRKTEPRAWALRAATQAAPAFLVGLKSTLLLI